MGDVSIPVAFELVKKTEWVFNEKKDRWQRKSPQTKNDLYRRMLEECAKNRIEPSLYIAGDTIWCSEVEEALERHQPEIVVVNSGAAQVPAGSDPITMTKVDVAEVCRHMPSAIVIAVHMEAINHCLVRRKELEDFIESEGLLERVRIPADGKGMKF